MSEFKSIYNLVKKTLKNTKYVVITNVTDDDSIQLHDKGRSKDIVLRVEREFGHTIAIVNPEVQAPYESDERKFYNNALVTITENHEDFNEYCIDRVVSYMYDSINLDSSTVKTEGTNDIGDIEYISKVNVKKYIKENLLIELDKLSAYTIKLKELRENLFNDIFGKPETKPQIITDNIDNEKIKKWALQSKYRKSLPAKYKLLKNPFYIILYFSNDSYLLPNNDGKTARLEINYDNENYLFNGTPDEISEWLQSYSDGLHILHKKYENYGVEKLGLMQGMIDYKNNKDTAAAKEYDDRLIEIAKIDNTYRRNYTKKYCKKFLKPYKVV